MMNSSGKISSETGVNNKNLLTAGDAGFIFTTATLTSLVMSVIFTAVIYAIAAHKGLTADEYSKAVQETFLYNVFAYGLSSISVLLAVTAFSVYKQTKPFTPLPFNKFKVKYLIVGLVMIFGLVFGFSELNELFINFLSKIGYNKPDMTLPNDEWWQLIIWLVIAAALPAFLEEVLFRGYILEGLKGHSPVFVILIGGLLFSLFHQNPQQTLYQFVCGAAFFLIAYKSGSLWPGIIMHFTNNAAVLLIVFFFKEGFSHAVMTVFTVVGVICFVGAVIYLLFFDKKVGGERPIIVKNSPNHTKSRFFIFAAIGIVACLIMWIADIFAYTGV